MRAFLLALALAASATAQTDLERAFELYQDVQTEAAADLLVTVADDAARPVLERRQALEMLGLIYVQQRREAQARAAMEQLLDLEPPMIDLDVDDLHPELAGHYLEARRDRQGSYAVAPDGPRLQTVAIADFNNNAVHRRDEFDPMTEGFALEMIRHLNGATALRVVERARLDWLLRELDLQRDRNLIDPSTAVEVGRLLGASTVLLGDFVILNERLRLGVRFVSVETGEVLRTATVDGSPDALFEAVESLSLEVAGRHAGPPRPRPRGRPRADGRPGRHRVDRRAPGLRPRAGGGGAGRACGGRRPLRAGARARPRSGAGAAAARRAPAVPGRERVAQPRGRGRLHLRVRGARRRRPSRHRGAG